MTQVRQGGLIVNCPGFLVQLDPRELPQPPEPIYFYDMARESWMKFSTQFYISYTGPLSMTSIAILISDGRFILPPGVEDVGVQDALKPAGLSFDNMRRAALLLFHKPFSLS